MIAIYVHQLAPTGVAKNAILLADHLANEGRDVVLVTCVPGSMLPTRARHVNLFNFTPGLRLAEKLTGIALLARWILRDAPSVLISMGNHGHITALSASRILDRPPRLIVRLSNDIVREADLEKSPSLRHYIRLQGYSIIAKSADQVVTVSPALLDSPPLYAMDDDRKCVIENGVDIRLADQMADEPAPHEWFHSGARVVLAVGRLSRQKNFARLIEAMAILNRSMDCRLIIVGHSRDSTRARLARVAERQGIADKVLMAGSVENIYPWYRHADCFVLPSLWEGAPNVLLEAMAVGTPIAASFAAGNSSHVLGFGRFGVLFDPLDCNAMARAIGTQADRATALLAGERALDFDGSANLAAWTNLIDEVASRPVHSAEDVA